ncbi:SDR family oxidoreductase [Salisaeta longa]|uniref:SDR family oxidoreductase n=1 Tax=Salisaeta longa TaxID=503170 RepID=UPI0003B33CB7|nr:SDR family oxidoreductase [Salisaeta longa]
MIFLTGFPGFLGTRLVQALAQRTPDAHFQLLVQPKFETKARLVLQDLGLWDRATLLPGDITQPDLGLGDRYDAVAESITEAYHLAAVYDLSIPREVGWRINVEGTRHVLDLLDDAPQLSVFGYVSTAYVSGRRTGVIREEELTHHAGFKNFYEETKYHAEVLVQERFDTLPTVVFRPGIVVGDSKTGATDKFDGPYFILSALQKLPRYTLMTRIGTGQETVNLVPVDFVIDAMLALSTAEHAGTVFHLTDPQPLTTQQIMKTFTTLLNMKVAYVGVPPAVARGLMNTGPGRALGIAPELIDYFDHAATYDSQHTQSALAGTGIRCPSLRDYAPAMVRFMQAHGGQRAEAMY